MPIRRPATHGLITCDAEKYSQVQFSNQTALPLKTTFDPALVRMTVGVLTLKF
ncbi:MAG: hypothetical protein ACK41P_09880 [Asticcacaulis sp.]